jgi:hypothetical protein
MRVVISNESKVAFDGRGRFPMSIGMKLFAESGELIEGDWVHFLLPCSLPPGEERAFLVSLPSEVPEGARIEVDLIQESVAWFQQWGARPVNVVVNRAEISKD